MKISILAAFVTSLIGLAAAAPPGKTPTPTYPDPPARCLYSVLPASGTAYAASFSNKNITVPDIDRIFNNYIFTCQAGRNFTVHKYGSFGDPWFVGNSYYPANACGKGLFSNLVTTAQQWNKNYTDEYVECLPYKGQNGWPHSFENEAHRYFGSIKR